MILLKSYGIISHYSLLPFLNGVKNIQMSPTLSYVNRPQSLEGRISKEVVNDVQYHFVSNDAFLLKMFCPSIHKGNVRGYF